MEKLDPRLSECIKACWTCRTECMETLYRHCLQQGGQHAEARHVGLMTDCIEICQAAADFMSRESELHEVVCGVCAEVCDACARSCRAIGGPEMDKCTATCETCAEKCRSMSKQRNLAA